MAQVVTNPATAGDVNVHGFRLYFRNKVTTTAAVNASATVPVQNANWFKAGDTVYIGVPGASEQATVDSVTGNTITLAAAVTGEFPQGTPVRRVAWWHLGHVRNPDRTQEREVQEIFSAITGKSTKIKEIVTSVSKGLTFESISESDDLVRALHTGNPAYAGAVAGSSVYVDDVNMVDGEILLVQENAETGGIAYVEYKPAAQVSGDGFAQGADGENESALQFTCSFNADANYTVPAAIVASEPSAPFGVIVKCAADDLDDIVDVFADLTA